MTNASNVGEVDVAASRATRDAMDATQWWKPQPGEGKKWGDNFLRLMPPHINMGGKFYYDIPLHFGIGPGRATVPCPKLKLGMYCPLCEMHLAFKNSGKEQDAEALRAKFYGYVNVVPLKDDGTPSGDPPSVRVLSTPKTVIDLILDMLEGDHPDLFSLETGRNVSLRRRGSGKMDTKYSIKPAPEPSAFDYPELIEKVGDLTLVSPYLDAEKMLGFAQGDSRPDPFSDPPSARGTVTGAVLPARTMPVAADEEGEEESEEQGTPAAQDQMREEEASAAPRLSQEEAQAALRRDLAAGKPENTGS